MIDGHVHLVPGRYGAEELLGWMDRDGVGAAVLLAELSAGLPGAGGAQMALARRIFGGRAAWLGRPSYRRVVRGGTRIRWGGRERVLLLPPDNGSVARASSWSPERLWYFPTVRSASELRAASALGRVRGVKVHAWWHGVALGEQDGLWDLCAEGGWPVLIHLGGEARTGRSALEVARRRPEVRYILAHGGLPYIRESARAAAELPNVWLDTSGPLLDDGVLRGLIRRPGPGRLIFGSDAPTGLWSEEGGISWSGLRARYEGLLSGGAREAVLEGNLTGLVSRAGERH
jgi:hypothetical protein